jgi:hypothetical protein
VPHHRFPVADRRRNEKPPGIVHLEQFHAGRLA